MGTHSSFLETSVSLACSPFHDDVLSGLNITMISSSSSGGHRGMHLFMDSDLDHIHGAGLDAYTAPCAELGLHVDVHGHAILYLVDLLIRHRVDGKKFDGIDRAGDNAVAAAGTPVCVDMNRKRHRSLLILVEFDKLRRISKQVNLKFFNLVKNSIQLVNTIFFISYNINPSGSAVPGVFPSFYSAAGFLILPYVFWNLILEGFISLQQVLS
jgi:hypothetical protein